MRESKLKGYKSAFISSVVNNELFNDKGLFLMMPNMLYNAHHVMKYMIISEYLHIVCKPEVYCNYVVLRNCECNVERMNKQTRGN